MADHEIVSKFLLNTCRSRRGLNYNALFGLTHIAALATVRGSVRGSTEDKETEYIPIATGSAAEFYIEPILSCVGDIDIMISSIVMSSQYQQVQLHPHSYQVSFTTVSKCMKLSTASFQATCT